MNKEKNILCISLLSIRGMEADGGSARAAQDSWRPNAKVIAVVWTTPFQLDLHCAVVCQENKGAYHGHESTAVQFVFGTRASFAKSHVCRA